MKRSRILPFILFGVLFTLFIITSCDGLGPRLKPTQTPAPPPAPLKACKSSETYYSNTEGILGNMNQRASIIAGDIYIQSLNARAVNDEARLLREKSRALQLLAYETLRWSRVEDKQEDGKKLRIIITFISPELVHAVVLNTVISSNLTLPNNNLSEYTKSILQGMDQRREYVFLLTMQAELPKQTDMEIELRPKKILLKKMEEFQVPASQVDKIYSQAFNMASSSQRAGFIYFPQTVTYENECVPVLDALHDKDITVVMENVKINEQKGSLNFQIAFAPPLGIEIPVPTPNPNLIIPSDQYAPSAIVPSIQDIGPTGLMMALTSENLQFWQDVGRFVWANLTLAYPQ